MKIFSGIVITVLFLSAVAFAIFAQDYAKAAYFMAFATFVRLGLLEDKR